MLTTQGLLLDQNGDLESVNLNSHWPHRMLTAPPAYPSTVIIGPTLFGIPAEELFFFVIQAYIVSVPFQLIVLY
jgi:hypothetical protein